MRVLVIGDGPLRAQMPEWADALGLGQHVIFTGHREDVPNCMKAMDVCVLPSLRNEATSQVMPQSMLVGTPVICSSAGGLTEVVQDGVTGRVVPPGDAPALAQALMDCLLEPLATARMAQQARQHALTYLTFEQQMRATLKVYRSVMDHKEAAI
jgi:glycosyltransferase involved in cell wall biosynthesis